MTRTFTWLVGTSLAVAIAAGWNPPPALAQDGALPPDWGASLRAIEPLSRTGVLYDRVLPLAHLDQLDGSATSPVVDRAWWRQGFDELRRASLAASGPDLAALDESARASTRAGVIPLALFDRAFERIRPSAVSDGSVRIDGDRLALVGANVLVESRALAACALVERTFRGADVTFALDADRYVSDSASRPRALAIDFADGRGFVPVRLGERVHVRYASVGKHTLKAALTRADGSTAETRFTMDVEALATPTPDDTLHVTATAPYQGQYGTGDAYVYLAPGHAVPTNPVVIVEGFDFDNSMNWDELYALLNQENLLETLRADGFDAVVLNFTDATVAVEQNANVVSELIQQVQSLAPPENTLALVGASMGALCARYALDDLETRGIPHRVRTWISFDGPHAGADLPLGLQYWIKFFSGQSADAAAFLAVLQRPAAREMLVYHFTDPPGTTGQPDPMRAQLLAAFSAVGGYPMRTRSVAVANGSGTGASQGFLPGNQVVVWDYSSLFVDVQGDIWSLPNQVSQTIFKGKTRVLFSTTSQTVNVSGAQPWDGAPGGSRASFAELDAIPAPYGDIVALHPSHCFVPTVSSLDLATGDPFFDIAGAPNLLALTPFDAVYYPSANQEHVLVTAENAAWIRNEIEQGVVSVAPSGSPRSAAASLSSSPDPFRESLRLTFTLPRAGRVGVRVFDVRGREVRQLLDETRSAGVHTLTWDGRDARGATTASGVFFVELEADGRAVVRRVVKLR